MGLRYVLRLYKGGTPEEFRHALATAALRCGGRLIWGEPGEAEHDLRVGSNANIHTLYMPHQAADFAFCAEVGCVSDLPWIELRIQEGSIWEYSLLQGASVLDRFSVCPQYWRGSQSPDDLLKTHEGQPQLLAQVWGVPVEAIEQYLVNWGYTDDPSNEYEFRFPRTGFAYPTDAHPYGDYEQFFDFLKALGGIEPMERHTIVLPSRERESAGAN